MAAKFKLGSRVVVPFGFREVEGTVVRVSEVGTHLWVTVAIDSPELELDEPFVTTFEGKELRAASAA